LNEAGAEKADALIATTNDDAANLMAMFLGVECGIETLISIVNQRAHQNMFERLNAHVLVDPEAITARYLYKLLSHHRVEETNNLPDGEAIFQATIGEQSPLIGKTPAEAREQDMLPDELFIVSLKRDDNCTVDPADSMTLQAGDRVVVFAPTPFDDQSAADPFTG
jgi:trk system potassium uptake protein TrkA